MPQKQSKNQLIIFVKYPEEGKVKTRLASKIGNKNAAAFYSEIAKGVVQKLSSSGSYVTNIFYSPTDKEKGIKKWLEEKESRYYPQQGNSLGEKIINAFEKTVSNGGQNLIIAGSDCTEITLNDITSSFDILDTNKSQIVIGPATDGGYYLLGLNIFCKDIFQDIEWSSEKVLSQTIEKLKKNNLSYILLRELCDIDELEDIDLKSLEMINSNLAEEIKSSIIKLKGAS